MLSLVSLYGDELDETETRSIHEILNAIEELVHFQHERLVGNNLDDYRKVFRSGGWNNGD